MKTLRYAMIILCTFATHFSHSVHGSSILDIYEFDEYIGRSLVYMGSDMRNSLIRFCALLPDYKWSDVCRNICLDIADGCTVAMYEDVKQVLEEISYMHGHVNPAHANGAVAHLERYKKKLITGKTHLCMLKNSVKNNKKNLDLCVRSLLMHTTFLYKGVDVSCWLQFCLSLKDRAKERKISCIKNNENDTHGSNSIKVSVNDVELFQLSETQQKVIQNEVQSEMFEADMKRRIQWIVMHKYEQCFKNLKEEWDNRLKNNGVTMIPTDPDLYAELVFSQPNYKNSTQRNGIKH